MPWKVACYSGTIPWDDAAQLPKCNCPWNGCTEGPHSRVNPPGIHIWFLFFWSDAIIHACLWLLTLLTSQETFIIPSSQNVRLLIAFSTFINTWLAWTQGLWIRMLTLTQTGLSLTKCGRDALCGHLSAAICMILIIVIDYENFFFFFFWQFSDSKNTTLSFSHLSLVFLHTYIMHTEMFVLQGWNVKKALTYEFQMYSIYFHLSL